MKHKKGLDLCISKLERTQLLSQPTTPNKTVIIEKLSMINNAKGIDAYQATFTKGTGRKT